MNHGTVRGTTIAVAHRVPTISHEAPIAVFREAPELVPELLRDALGVAVPHYAEVELAEADFTQVVPAELRADLVLVLRGAPPERAAVMGIVVEVQRSRDERKRFTWPLYLAALRARHACPTCLVVVAPDDRIAAWAAEPIVDLHPGTVLAPIVLGPGQVPRVTAAQAAHQPWLAVLSAVVHGNRPGGVQIARLAIEALARAAGSHARFGSDLIRAALDVNVRQTLEMLMKVSGSTKDFYIDFHGWKYPQSDFHKKYFGEAVEAGLAEGQLWEVRHLLGELAARKIGELSEARRARIEACADVARLEQVLMLVAEAPDAETAARLLDAI